MTILSGIGSPQEMKHTDEKWHTESFAWGNARKRRKDFWTKDIEKSWKETQDNAIKRFVSCFNCPQQCGGLISHGDVSSYMMKCFSKLTYLMGAYVDDLDFGFRIAKRAFEYGVDSFSTPQILAFAVELYEAGILTDKDFRGVSDRQGGPVRLAPRSAGAERGNRRRPGRRHLLGRPQDRQRRRGLRSQYRQEARADEHQTRHARPLYYLMYATNEKISITQIEGNWPQGAFPSREDREAFVADWPQLPDDKFKQYFLDWNPRGENSNPYYPTPQMCSEIVDWMEMLHNVDDAIGLCAGMGSFCLKPPYHIHNYPKLISAATGMDLDEEGLKKIVSRSRNLHRAFNNRRGMTRADEKPPEDHWKHRFPEYEEQLLSTYYTYKGWNHDGVPTREKLMELDLGYVADDLEKRGILKDGQNKEDN